MDENKKKPPPTRREFIRDGFRYSLALGIAGVGGILAFKSTSGDMVWQLDASKCVQCGRCVTNCVLTPSAVKCMHVYDMCGYCDLCGGYFRPGVKDLTTAAENQLCPTSAIERKFIEEPFFEYHIDEDLCNGCGKCVKGCGAFGNGSLQLQVNHSLCVNCNECSIARDCPADAFTRVPAKMPYLFKGFNNQPST
jgi:electron transport complex protein RnfB